MQVFYLNSAFDVFLPRCPQCGLTMVPKSLAEGKMWKWKRCWKTSEASLGTGRFSARGGRDLAAGGPELTRRALELPRADAALRRARVCWTWAVVRRKPGTAGRAGYRPLGLDRRTHAAWAKRAAGAERSPAVIFLQGDAACPPLADNSVDGVLSECVLSSCLTLWTRCAAAVGPCDPAARCC